MIITIIKGVNMNKNKLLQAMLIASLVLTGCGNSEKDAHKDDDNKAVSQAKDVSKEEVKEDGAEQNSSTVKIKIFMVKLSS